MRQTGNVGRRRGSFVRLYPATSRQAIYFAPSIALVAGGLLGALAIRAQSGHVSRPSPGLAWGALERARLPRRSAASTSRSRCPRALAAGHGAYGWQFMRGLMFGSDECVSSARRGLPGMSVVIPTLNSAKYLAECLQSIVEQDYPRELLRSSSPMAARTTTLAPSPRATECDRIVENRLVTGEAGKALGIECATRELILMVDSDNVLVGSDWLRRMARPLIEDPTVVSSECLRWEYRSEDHFINRYQALTGVNDPMSLFIGNYDRWSELHQRWTAYPVKSERRDAWERVELAPERRAHHGRKWLPRAAKCLRCDSTSGTICLTSMPCTTSLAGLNVIARVDVPIRHYFCDSTWRFYRKTRRRTDDFFFFRSKGMRTYPWTTRQRLGVVRFVVSTVLVIPLLAQVYSGYRRVADPAWLFHVPACLITLGVYAAARCAARRGPLSSIGRLVAVNRSAGHGAISGRA